MVTWQEDNIAGEKDPALLSWEHSPKPPPLSLCRAAITVITHQVQFGETTASLLILGPFLAREVQACNIFPPTTRKFFSTILIMLIMLIFHTKWIFQTKIFHGYISAPFWNFVPNSPFFRASFWRQVSSCDATMSTNRRAGGPECGKAARGEMFLSCANANIVYSEFDQLWKSKQGKTSIV